MKYIFLNTSVLAIITHNVLADFADPKTPPLDGYTISFSDEFNGNSLNEKKWNIGINQHNAILSNRQSAYTLENLTVSNGSLKLYSKKEPKPIETKFYGGKKGLLEYSSGAINTQGLYQLKGEFYLEIRCKLPENAGGFAAFWTMPEKTYDIKKLGTKGLHETDFFEFITNIENANNYRYFSSIWWHAATEKENEILPEGETTKRDENYYWIKQQKYKLHIQKFMKDAQIDFSKPFTMGFKATKDKLSWHIVQKGTAYNAPAYFTYTEKEVHGRKDPETGEYYFAAVRPVPSFDNYLIFNYRVSDHKWSGGPVNDSQLPAFAAIDYIRVYQKN